VIGVLAGVGMMIFGYSYYSKQAASGSGGFGGFGGGGGDTGSDGGMEKRGFSELIDDDDDAQL
jgi:hypothetical protein